MIGFEQLTFFGNKKLKHNKLKMNEMNELITNETEEFVHVCFQDQKYFETRRRK